MNKYQKYFKNVCLETSKLSTCYSRQVGSILVRDNRIAAIGYNGVVSGAKHCYEIFSGKDLRCIKHRRNHHDWSLKNEIHSEVNLISYCARNGIKTGGADIYISLAPCINCAMVICAAGIKTVYYIEEYDIKGNEGIEFLTNNGINVIHIK